MLSPESQRFLTKPHLGRLKCDLRSRHSTHWLILGDGRDEPVAFVLAPQELLLGLHMTSLIELPAK